MARVAIRSRGVSASLGVCLFAGLTGQATLSSGRPPALPALPTTLDVVADRDDDDLDGVPDAEEAFLAPLARVDALPLGPAFRGVTLTPESGGEHARVIVGGRPVAWGALLPADARVQGVSPGVVHLRVRRGEAVSTLVIAVTGLGLRDGTGSDVDFTRSHASLDRSPPAAVSGDAASHYDEPDPLRLTVTTPNESPPSIRLESVGPDGSHEDGLPAPVLTALPCPVDAAHGSGPGEQDATLHCYASDPIRFVIDEVDSRHALAAARSLRAELGGAIVLRIAGRKAQAIRVLGPRDTPSGPIGRLRTTLRPFVVRLTPGGVPAIGGNDAGAVTTLRAELSQAALAWAECGVSFGPVADIPVRVVDPPVSHVLAIGDLLGMPASGGHIHVSIEGKKEVVIATHHGELPMAVARAAAEAFTSAGYSAVVSPNARVASGAEPSADVLARSARGAPVALEPVRGLPLSDDASLVVRIGQVDLSDGLDHFTDMDAVAGTLEERTLLKAFDDGDPTTVEVVVVPFFSGGGRIGESFIGTDRSSLRNVIVFDRAGVRARRTSLTLAHELGHVLLDVPGHPDDYGVDTPTRLMDADASDASPFGPRRLTLAECARVVRESGPGARVPLLRDWPLTPLVYPTAAP